MLQPLLLPEAERNVRHDGRGGVVAVLRHRRRDEATERIDRLTRKKLLEVGKSLFNSFEKKGG